MELGSWQELLSAVAYLTMVFACLQHNNFQIRVAIIALALLAMIQVHLHGGDNLLSLSLLALLSIVNLMQIFIESKHISIRYRSENEKLLHKFLHHFSIPQLKRLDSQGEYINAGQGEMIIEIGKPVLHLRLLIRGEARVVKNNENITFLRPGDLIGEMSYISNQPASATVCLTEDSLYIQWPQDPLKRYLLANEDLQSAMEKTFSEDFIRKHAKKIN